MEVLKSELESISQTLNAMRKVKHKLIAVKVIKNQVLLAEHITNLNAEIQLTRTPAVDAFFEKERAIMKNFVRLTDKGQPKMLPNGEPDFIDKESFQVEHAKLKEENPEVVTYLNTHRERVNGVFTEKVDINFDLFEFDELPEALNAEEIDALGFLIKNFEAITTP